MIPEKQTHKRVQKSWGYELWIDNNDEYCGKLLVFIDERGHTSMHFHEKKRETMFCNQGRFVIDFIDMETGKERSVTLLEGESIQIPRLQLHRIRPLVVPSELFEFGTPHDDADSFRATPSYERTDG
jgi:mannose-6-phosphate isomerase-like protein (cupin superfamily)